jgi:hypothetical protein
MTTFEFYETIGTSELRRLLKKYEEILESNELKIENNDIDSYNLSKENIDNQIDISLIRMELNRRLWNM